jgi:hypothetical protein
MVHISFWFFADGVNMLGRNCNGKHRSLVVASKETGLEVIGDNAKYMVMSQGQNAG